MEHYSMDVTTKGSTEFESQFECPICLDIFTDPVMVSCCGNTICQKCIIQVNQMCPYCQKRTTYKKNIIIMKVMGFLTKKCACGVDYKQNEKKEHLNVCRIVEKKCRYCEFKGNSSQRMNHGFEVHKDILINMFLDYIN